MTCSYNSCAERERVIVCVRSDHHQRLNSVDTAELLSEYGCQCVRCDGCTQRMSTFFGPLSILMENTPPGSICVKFQNYRTGPYTGLELWFPKLALSTP
jgi:hypothetical protein